MKIINDRCKVLKRLRKVTANLTQNLISNADLRKCLETINNQQLTQQQHCSKIEFVSAQLPSHDMHILIIQLQRWGVRLDIIVSRRNADRQKLRPNSIC
jgi:hypothetical protein